MSADYDICMLNEITVNGRVLDHSGGVLTLSFIDPSEYHEPFSGLSLQDEQFFNTMAGKEDFFTNINGQKRNLQSYPEIPNVALKDTSEFKTLLDTESYSQGILVGTDGSLKLYSGSGSDYISEVGTDGESDEAKKNRNIAVQYALEHAEDTSDHDGLHYFSPETGGGSDCTNFVSQCLLAGGRMMSEEWFWRGLAYSGWRGTLGKLTVDASASWLLPDEFYRYFSKTEHSYGVSYITSVDDILEIAAFVKPGDVIAFNNTGEDIPKGEINHVAIVTIVENGEIFYCGHAEIRNNVSLSKVLTEVGYQGDLYFIHINYE